MFIQVMSEVNVTAYLFEKLKMYLFISSFTKIANK